jgi:elongation factor G
MADWKGWDKMSAYIPQAEMQDLIVELRSLTMGVGFFQWKYDRLQEVPDKISERVLSMLSDSSSGNTKSNGNGNGKR